MKEVMACSMHAKVKEVLLHPADKWVLQLHVFSGIFIYLFIYLLKYFTHQGFQVLRHSSSLCPLHDHL